MLKGNKIVLRKRIRDYDMIVGFEKLTKMRLPNPPKDIPVEEHCKVLSWDMNLEKERSIKSYKNILELFQLPFKTNGATRVHMRMKRTCWWDVMFEVYQYE